MQNAAVAGLRPLPRRGHTLTAGLAPLLFLLSSLSPVSCARTDAEVGPTASSVVAPPVASPAASPVPSPPVAPAPPADAACPKLPIHLGGTVDHQSFEGRVALATGHDPEQGDGTYAVLALDAPVCADYALEPSASSCSESSAENRKWEALGAKWNGQRVRVTGSVRSLDIYLGPMRHLLLFASRIDPAP